MLGGLLEPFKYTSTQKMENVPNGVVVMHNFDETTMQGEVYYAEPLIDVSVIIDDNVISVQFPKSVNKLNGFAYCDNLEEVYITKNITSLSNATGNGFFFRDCPKINKIVVDPENPVFDSRDNCNAIINTDTNKCIAGCGATIIPNTVATIGAHSFCNCKFDTFAIPDSVNTVEQYVFNKVSIKDFIVPDHITDLQDWFDSEPSTITNYIINGHLSSINNGAFSGVLIDNIYIPSLENWCLTNWVKYSVYNSSYGGSCKYYPSGPFSEKPGGNIYVNGELLVNLVIPENTALVKGMFSGCGSIETVEFSNNVTFTMFMESNWTVNGSPMGEYRNYFEDCSNIKSFKPSPTSEFKHYLRSSSKGLVAYAPSSGVDMVLDEKFSTVWTGAFSSTKTIDANISIESNVSLPDKCFKNCVGKLYINSNEFTSPNATKQPKWSYESRIKDIEFGPNVTDIGDYMFYQSYMGSRRNITLSENIKSIGEYSFYEKGNGSTYSQNIYCKALVPPVIGKRNVDCTNLQRIYVYVPLDAIDAYNNDESWSEACSISGYDFETNTIISTDN